MDRERLSLCAARRERTRKRLSAIRDRLGPIARGLLWLQLLLPITLVLALVMPDAAWSWLSEHEFILEFLLTYSLFCAPPLVTLLSATSRLPSAAKGRLIIATWLLVPPLFGVSWLGSL